MTSSEQAREASADGSTPSLAPNHTNMANAIRALAMDAVQQANSGHPGMPMGTADIATVLFTKFLKFDPANPFWPDRDRFVLSAGHGSMLLYALLHLLGYEDMTMEEIRNFRQLGSKTAGHPEYAHAAGVETTTGPLGQGLATAVGMALAERLLNARFGDDLMSHYTYVIASDGDLMEGISHEAIGLAGHLKLSKLIVLFDDNEISIDGPTSLATSEDAVPRFKAAGWNAMRIDGHDPEAIETAIASAQKSDKPTLIACRTVIGYGSPNKQGKSSSHGAALGVEEVALARKELGWSAEPFSIPASICDAWRIAGLRSAKAQKEWAARLAGADEEVRAEFDRVINGRLPDRLEEAIIEYKKTLVQEKPKLATRVASQKALEVINPVLTETIGGSADLTGSNNTRTHDLLPVTADDFSGRFIHYGIREHGMAAAMNGIALHGGLIPYSGTFLVFSDYCRPAIRLSALMGQRVVYVMTHDSIGLGEDGPTHQPVEHLAALRAIPNLNVFRPADAVETAECWLLALQNQKTPSVLALTRQGLPTVRGNNVGENLCAKGAYELAPAVGNAKVTFLATGSEVEIALNAKNLLQKEGIPARVVSMPCLELFEAQDRKYQEEVLGPGTVKVAIEAAVRLGWDRFIGETGAFVGMDSFGASAPYQDLYEHFGITAQAAADAAKECLERIA